jgi:hypothetical protein
LVLQWEVNSTRSFQLVGEQDDAVVAFLLQHEARVGADPFGGAGEELPEHQLAWNELFQLHFHGADFPGRCW